MRQLLEPTAFSDRRFAELENRGVFGHAWQLVAAAAELPSAGDFMPVDVAGRQYVLRRASDGSVRAFANVCLHRGARLCPSSGSGPLRCAYHGWTYDDRGDLVGIPFRSDFADEPELHRLTLRQARVEQWGPALFLHPLPSAPSLRDELGPLFLELDPAFRAMDQLLEHASIEIEANWKIVMENALETYHVRFVHGQTIQPLGFEVTRTDYQSAHSMSHYSAPPSPRKQRALDYAFPDRPFALDGYVHATLFPNSTVATAYGNFFVLTRTEPLAIGKTRLHWYMFSTRCGERSQGAIDAAQLMDESNRQFLRATFEEDGSICARTDQGCREALSAGYLGAQERRVAAFELEVMRRIELASASGNAVL